MIHWKRIGKEEKFGIVNAIMGVREATLVKDGVTEKTSIVVLCDLSEEKGLEACSEELKLNRNRWDYYIYSL